jgi:hypothetical protein
LGEPRIAAWYLEHKRPDEFGKNAVSTQDDTYWDSGQQKKREFDRETYHLAAETGGEVLVSKRFIRLMLEDAKEEVACLEAKLVGDKEEETLKLEAPTPVVNAEPIEPPAQTAPAEDETPSNDTQEPPKNTRMTNQELLMLLKKKTPELN